MQLQQIVHTAIGHFQAGRLDQAANLARQVLLQRPGHPEALKILGFVARQRGDLDAALENLTAATRAAPDDPMLWAALGDIHGRRQDHAAAASAFETLVRLDPKAAEPSLRLGLALRALGRDGKAAKALRQAAKLAGRDIAQVLRLGALALNSGAADDALDLFRQARKAAPAQPDVLYHIGLAHLALHQPEEALPLLEQIAAAHPDFVEGRLTLGTTLMSLGRGGDAIEHLRAAHDRQPDNRKAALTLADALRLQDEDGEAATLYRRLLEQDPDNGAALLGEAALLEKSGERAVVAERARRVLEREPGNVDAATLLIESTREPLPEPVVQAVEQRLSRGELAGLDRARAGFLLGKAFDQAGRADAAFGHYAAANDIYHQHFPFDRAAHARLVEETVATFTEDASDGGSDGRQPIFIVGMPRSGTSLVEQILSAHPLVQGAGERRDIREIAGELPDRTGGPYPACVPQLDPALSDELAAAYLARVLPDTAEPDQRPTDKMPDNFLHLGLIARLFPAARVVHCTRHPLDTCLSCYFRNFGNRQRFANHLPDLAAYYRDYRRLMDHWKTHAGLAILDVAYEDLVADPAARIPRLVEFCGLPWDERCLAPQENRRDVGTASRWQVREPIYRTSVERFRPYLPYLDDLTDALADFL